MCLVRSFSVLLLNCRAWSSFRFRLFFGIFRTCVLHSFGLALKVQTVIGRAISSLLPEFEHVIRSFPLSNMCHNIALVLCFVFLLLLLFLLHFIFRIDIVIGCLFTVWVRAFWGAIRKNWSSIVHLSLKKYDNSLLCSPKRWNSRIYVLSASHVATKAFLDNFDSWPQSMVTSSNFHCITVHQSWN